MEDDRERGPAGRPICEIFGLLWTEWIRLHYSTLETIKVVAEVTE